MDVVAWLMALVSPVNSLPTEVRAAVFSRGDDVMERVASVASEVLGQRMSWSELDQELAR